MPTAIVGLGGVVAGVIAVVSSSADVRSILVVGPASFAPILLGVTVLGLVVCIAAKRWWIAALSAAILTVSSIVALPLYVPGAAGLASADAGRSVTLMQSNVMLGRADAAALMSTVRERKVEVLTVQEITPEFVTSLDEAGIEEVLPYRFVAPYPAGAGAAIYSIFPLSGGRELPGFLLSNAAADLDVGAAQPVRVFSVHPIPPYPTPTQVWASELDLLAEEMSAPTEGSVVVSGDFNSTHAHKHFRDLLTGGYVDAADAVGAGVVPTYPTDKWYPPVVGIDHVVVRDGGVLSLDAVDVAGSDHRGLIATVLVP
ncbi:MAG: endonuclease/exonuclease/phosphatase family protein [Rhodococcus sp. (in: high G+C Gram-positive bacteria)]